jgi:mannose-1-phosphate guanylyltransferase
MVLCAGFGTRLRPLTDHFPKPLLPIGDRPAFQHIFDQLRAQHLGPFAVNTHHRAEAFVRAIPQDVAVLHEPAILGTAGGVANAVEALGPGDVLVWNGDMHLCVGLASLLATHARLVSESDVVATLLVAKRAAGQGTVGVSRDGRVARLRGATFLEEAFGADYLGVMVLAERGRGILPREGCLVGDVLMPRLRAGESVGVAWHDGDWVDIGTPQEFVRANLLWLRNRGLQAWCAPDAVVSPSVELRESVVASGGAVEGEGEVRSCVVLPGSVLRAPARRVVAIPSGTLPI